MARLVFPYTHVTVADEGFRITIECDTCADWKRESSPESVGPKVIWVHGEELHRLMAMAMQHLKKVHGQSKHIQQVQEVAQLE